VMGSQRKYIIVQFLMEHFIISLIAVFLAVVLANLITPFYVGLYLDIEADVFDFTNYTYIVPFLFFILIFTTFISGAYPAFYISKLKTADALRRNLKLKSGSLFTYFLLTLQLIITVTCLGMGISFVDNINYINKVDKGFDIENIITVLMVDKKEQRDFDLYKSKIIENPDILVIAGSEQHISWSSRLEKTKYKEAEYEVMVLPTGENCLQTMGVNLKQGRLFEANNFDDKANIINPLSENIALNGRPYKIIGVVGDFMQSGVRHHIKPMVIVFRKNTPNIMVIRTPKDKIIEVNKFLEKKWIETFDALYVGYRQIEWLDFDRSKYETMRTIFLSASVIALLLSLFGLYVLISLIINKISKEIGIRKVMGSPIQNIIFILGKNFIYIFGIAALVGSLAGLYITKLTLDTVFEIENHVEVTPIPFLISSFAITLLAVCTISYKVFSAANANPVISLKTE
jgi:putative ABC transport system permease protein